jgi:hypothetical protein
VVNEYSGWAPSKKDTTIDRVPYASLTPKDFFDRYVAPCKPCVLVGHPSEASGWHASRRWSNKHLCTVAGDAVVQVEERAGLEDRFGQLREVMMPFRKVVQLIAGGDGLHYMTTQVCE